jgi:hypothetical protein
MKVWSISELLSSNELIAEGRQQNHCVATYTRSCYSGSTSIWTMDVQMGVQGDGGREKKLTIELHKPSKTIRQIRGLRNRLATPAEMDIIARWAAKEQFSITNYG